MDEIQRSLRASLQTGPGAAAREESIRKLPEDPDALSFWLSMAVRLSRPEPWWYDTLAVLVRSYLRSREWQEKRELPGELLSWCAGVATGEIMRPGGRGRPAKPMRDALICAAIAAYLAPRAENEGCLLGEACASGRCSLHRGERRALDLEAFAGRATMIGLLPRPGGIHTSICRIVYGNLWRQS